jgi:hypothetical protein
MESNRRRQAAVQLHEGFQSERNNADLFPNYKPVELRVFRERHSRSSTPNKQNINCSNRPICNSGNVFDSTQGPVRPPASHTNATIHACLPRAMYKTVPLYVDSNFSNFPRQPHERTDKRSVSVKLLFEFNRSTEPASISSGSVT